MKPVDSSKAHRVGRGAQISPANRFESTVREDDFQQLEEAEICEQQGRAVATEFLPDDSRTIICRNDSPDIPFQFSINPYRGCEHGCAYCYARPSHEFLGMNAGLDFESKVLVKYNAADLLRHELNQPAWRCEPIAISGVTDCYQPVERRLKITRSLLEVLLEASQPAGIVTKNSLVARDLDLLSPMAARNLVHVFISITTLDAQLARHLEPRTAAPSARLRAVEQLVGGGVPVGVMMAPLIPGLNDDQICSVLSAAADAGATCASYVMLRLPLAVEPIFRDWVARYLPLKKERIESSIRQCRGGRLNDSQFGRRLRGTGVYAQQIQQMFGVFRQKFGLEGRLPTQDTTQFRPPQPRRGQMSLF